MAAAHVLHYGVGVPVRKVPAVLRALTGVELSQGAISQDALRRARGAVGDAYHKLRGSVLGSPLVHTDDTGWRVDGGPAFLMAFETDEATVYQVRARHRNEEVREVVPSDYGGVMVTDRGRSYDAQALSGVKQQKCLAHVLRSISEVVQTKRGRGRSFGNRLSRLLREAMELRQAYHRGAAADFAAEAERLRREATYHLRDRPMSDADNYRLQNELGWHHDRGNLLRFLDDPSIEPTNNRAERALRPAVIARKVSHCSKNVGGADAFSAFTSVIRTLARNGDDHSLVNGLCGVFSGAPVPTPSFPTQIGQYGHNVAAGPTGSCHVLIRGLGIYDDVQGHQSRAHTREVSIQGIHESTDGHTVPRLSRLQRDPLSSATFHFAAYSHRQERGLSPQGNWPVSSHTRRVVLLKTGVCSKEQI